MTPPNDAPCPPTTQRIDVEHPGAMTGLTLRPEACSQGARTACVDAWLYAEQPPRWRQLRKHLMQRFVITEPKGKKTTVQLLNYRYRSRQQALEAGKNERGTPNNYLGSFNLKLDPRRLDGVQGIGSGQTVAGVRVRPGKFVDGVLFELTADDVAIIRQWLEEHGSVSKERRRLEELQAQQTAVDLAARATLELEVRAQVRADILQELAAELKSRNAVQAMQAACEALDRAGAAVQQEAAELRENGRRLTLRRRKSNGKDTAEEQLLAATLAVRCDGFGRFEAACQSAGLMSKKSSRGAGASS